MSSPPLKKIVEAVLFAHGKPMTVDALLKIFIETDDVRPDRAQMKRAIKTLQKDWKGRGVELVEVASGYRFQASVEVTPYVSRLWDEKPQKYSRASLETLALIAYRQPITRSEIEEIRGVSVSTHIIKSLLEREWVRVVGTKEVPGRPSLYATTKTFLDYFSLTSLDQLPALSEIRDLDTIAQELENSQGDQVQLAFEEASLADADVAVMAGVHSDGEVDAVIDEPAVDSVETETEVDNDQQMLDDESASNQDNDSSSTVETP
jgi:segregation and condensation protein B